MGAATEFLRDNFWSGIAIWAALTISDYILTIVGARLYKSQENIVFEGSFELTPMFEADVNALRRLSPRLLRSLAVGCLGLWGVWLLSNRAFEGNEAYVVVIGSFVLVQLAVHVRHIRNWFFLRHGVGQHGVHGHIEYPRGFMLRQSAVELLIFAALFLVLAGFTSSLLILGGAVGCIVLALKHASLARSATGRNLGRSR